MLIHSKGKATREFAPDQIKAYVNFKTTQKDYLGALETGVNMVNSYIQAIAERTGFSAQDFKTSSYSIRELYHYAQASDNRDLADIGKERRISDGFEFSQRATLIFDYDRDKLENLLLSAAYAPDAPRIYVDFQLKDPAAKRLELLPEALNNARAKAQTIANAAGKNLVECKEVFTDEFHQKPVASDFGSPAAKMSKLRAPGSFSTINDYDDRLQKIDASFHPEPIKLSKHIDTLWSTN